MSHLLQEAQPLILVALAAVLGRLVPLRFGVRAVRALEGARAPGALGVATAVLTWWTWGSLDPLPLSHDEAAYLLQAALLASGQIVGPSPPIPEFFEQFHVFVTPHLIPKYPLGFPAALVPGVWLGLPALVPVLLSGATAALLFATARRVATPAIALTATALWVAAPDGARFRPAYFSESLSSMTWMLGCWALLRWRDTRRPIYLLLIGAACAATIVARPLTGAAYITFMLVVVLASWRPEPPGRAAWLVPGALLLLAIPVQNRTAFGDWHTMPYAEYSRVHFPADRPGFGLDTSPPLRPLPPDFQAYAASIRPIHAQHDAASVPDEVQARARRFSHGAFGWRDLGYLLLVAVGLAWGGPLLQLAALGGAGLFAWYAVFAHPFSWTLYYQEALPVIVTLAAAGAATIIALLQRHPALRGNAAPAWATPGVTVALVLLSCVSLIAAVARHADTRARRQRAASATEALWRATQAIRSTPAIVFLPVTAERYHWSIVWNAPDYRKAPVWLVRDRGPLNAELRRLAPERTAFVYDVEEQAMLPMDPLP